MYNIAIIEDDNKFATELKQSVLAFAEENGYSFNISVFRSVEDFLLPRQYGFDIVFFDIELPGMNGMDGAKLFRETDDDAIIIFLTNLLQYAIHGYEVGAMDYMLKPISYKNLSLKLQKAIRKAESRQYKTVIFHGRDGIRKVNSVDIYYIEIREHKITAHTETGEIEATGNISDYEKELKGYNYSRCNNCYLVNMRAITRIDGMSVWLRNGDEIHISRRKKKEFLNDFTQYIGK